MFAGHFAIAYFLLPHLKNPKSQIVVFLTILSPQVVDVVTFVLSALGLEGGTMSGHSSTFLFDIKWSHSLFMVLVWGLIYALVVSVLTYKQTDTSGSKLFVILFAGVLSHFLLDFLVHANDLYLSPWSDKPMQSLYFWEYPLLGFLSELLIIFLALGYYLKNSGNTIETTPFVKKVFALVTFLAIFIYLPSFVPFPALEGSPVIYIGFGTTIILICLLLTRLHPLDQNKL